MPLHGVDKSVTIIDWLIPKSMVVIVTNQNAHNFYS